MPSVEFILFACVLAGVALFHTQAMRIAVAGAVVIAAYKVLWSPFKTGAGLPGLGLHLQHEWVILVNLLLLLLGFALLADLFEKSKVPAVLPAYLPGRLERRLPAAGAGVRDARAFSTTSPRR